ncbi:4'-phosphopantetheinyl transferase family protein [Paenibacillus tyrfis]|uniref:4'-phosphopantetheinyl transferase family protein n=1 Tax=Paenibacillus tyrfis TaxID=1501230 RepID=UPI000B591523|nr:4'-phosphopantetheinyl transferase superfamily protein [Paenibacillus tyrfis]
MGEVCPPESFVQGLDVRGGEEPYSAWLSVCCAQSAAEYQATIPFLHPNELAFYEGLQFERRITSYLAGRYAAKRAVAATVQEERLDRIWIDRGILHQPLIVHPAALNLQVSISHCDELGAALVFPEALPMGLDVEQIRPARQAVLAAQMTERERERIGAQPGSEALLMTLYWSAKEALSKVLKTGLAVPFEFFEITGLEQQGTAWVAAYSHFPQFRVAGWVVGERVFAIAYPKDCRLNLEAVQDLLCKVEEVI